MAAGSASRVIRAPGRLVVNPTSAFASSAFPFGGTQIGRANQCVLRSIGEPYRVEYESTGETGEILNAGNRYVFACFLRGWDSDAVESLLSDGHEDGSYTGHARFDVPGSRLAGQSAFSRAVRLAFVPDDTLHANGVVMFHAVPTWTDGADMAFQRGAELGLPLTFECVRDTQGRVLQIGRMEDMDHQ